MRCISLALLASVALVGCGVDSPTAPAMAPAIVAPSAPDATVVTHEENVLSWNIGGFVACGGVKINVTSVEAHERITRFLQNDGQERVKHRLTVKGATATDANGVAFNNVTQKSRFDQVAEIDGSEGEAESISTLHFVSAGSDYNFTLIVRALVRWSGGVFSGVFSQSISCVG